jgi:hypothetical protein
MTTSKTWNNEIINNTYHLSPTPHKFYLHKLPRLLRNITPHCLGGVLSKAEGTKRKRYYQSWNSVDNLRSKIYSVPILHAFTWLVYMYTTNTYIYLYTLHLCYDPTIYIGASLEHWFYISLDLQAATPPVIGWGKGKRSQAHKPFLCIFSY